MTGGRLREQVGKKDPFDSSAQEACLNLMRSANEIGGPFHALFKKHNLTQASYNVLRILRGHLRNGERGGVRASSIGCEMVVRVPDVTRLVDRLVTMGLAERHACDHDRRVVYVLITDAGLDMLDTLDEPVRELHRRTLGHLSESELHELNRLLELARHEIERMKHEGQCPLGDEG